MPSRCRLITNRKTKVCHIGYLNLNHLSLTKQKGERARISAAGGFVDFGRVNGNLALSRAIGDFEFKKSADLSPEQQIVTAYPDVTTHNISEDDEFLVIACDGTSLLDFCPIQTQVLTFCARYLGLPIFAGRRRVRPSWHCCKARASQDLREHDG